MFIGEDLVAAGFLICPYRMPKMVAVLHADQMKELEDSVRRYAVESLWQIRGE